MSEYKEKRQQKIATYILGGVLFPLGLAILFALIPDFFRSLSGPEPMTLTQAAEIADESPSYVTFTDGEWDCDSIQVIRGRSSSTSGQTDRNTQAFMTNESGAIVVLVTMSGRMDCDELESEPVSGYLELASEDQVQELTNNVRLAKYINRQVVLDMYGYCGSTNSLIGIVMSLFMVALGGLFLWVGYRLELPEKEAE